MKLPNALALAFLQEDQFGSAVEACLCPTHAAKYLLKRYQYKCSYQGCNRLGKVTTGGVNLCWTHESESQRRRSRSRSREKKEVDDKDAPAEEIKKGGEARDEAEGGLDQLMSELREIKGSLKREPERRPEEEPRRRRLSSRFFGFDAQIQRAPEFGEAGHVGLSGYPSFDELVGRVFREVHGWQGGWNDRDPGEEDDGPRARHKFGRHLSTSSRPGFNGTEQGPKRLVKVFGFVGG